MSTADYPEFYNQWDKDVLDVRALIGTFWHRDGPHSPQSIAKAAEAIDQLAHYLARATQGSGERSAVNAAVLYDVLGELQPASWKQDEILTHLAGRADELAADPTLYDDRDDQDAGDTAKEVARHLRAARLGARAVRVALEDARNAASHLGQR